MKTLQSLSLSLVAALALTACGGGGGGSSVDGTVTPQGVARGSSVDQPATLATLTTAQINAGAQTAGLSALTGAAHCDVKVVALNYNTIGANAEATNESGVLLMPTGSASGCNGPFPLVAYARGTEFVKTRTLANPADSETFLLVAMLATQGYAVVATDYLGYAKSKYPFHPYLHANSEAASVIDSIRAARVAVTTVGGTLNGKVLLAGYSQGGHSSAATQRAIEASGSSEFNVIGAAHMAGPYNLSTAVQDPDPNNPIFGYQFFTPFLITSYQKVYGNVYTDVSTVFKAPYATGIDSLLPNATLDSTTLVTSGKLPGGTPAQAKAALMQPAFLSDLATNVNNGLFVNAKKNDETGWKPMAPTLLCGGSGDPVVPMALHMTVAKASFDQAGSTSVAVTDVDSLIQNAFGVAPTDPTSPAFATYYGNYHGVYEPPICMLQARQFFNTLR